MMRAVRFSFTAARVLAPVITFFCFSCGQPPACHKEMVKLLALVNKQAASPKNQFAVEAKIPYMDSLIALPRSTESQRRLCKYLRAHLLLELGRESEATDILESIRNEDDPQKMDLEIMKELAMVDMRVGERVNCVEGHAAESCILPLRRMGIHRDVTASRKAISIYQHLLEIDPKDLESRWLLNIAYQTIGEYPKGVPAALFIPGMNGDTTVRVKPFVDVAGPLGLDVKNMAGGSIVEDFDNDGYLDLVTSGWGLKEPIHYFRNKADGTFEDLSVKSHLGDITGGLNIMQTDYNNDGLKDIFVLRGGWKGAYGKEPNSLLRNNGDGTFSDVTTISGLLSFHPTQTATWNDFDNDGWLDLFIGNETSVGSLESHACELYMNNRDGTFRDVAAAANCNIRKFVKGVTSGDYDHDGLKDLFLSTMNGERILLHNEGTKGKQLSFKDVTNVAGLGNEKGNTFPTWFWDYNNDGWLDIFVCDYTFTHSLGYYEAAEKLNIDKGSPEKMMLYRNNHDGTFTNVAKDAGLNTNVFAMGSNFGDIDNDGFLDMYLGSGNPSFQSLVPNKMFLNQQGEKFADVTATTRVGHLQKGHGVSFADMDNDGDQDIYIEMGGAYPGDAYQSSFFLNPGESKNHWICIQLEGTKSNKAAIGTSLKLTFRENGKARSVYRDVNSGGSFGASPLRREIGVGSANVIDQIEISWHGGGLVQRFTNVASDQFVKIREGDKTFTPIAIKKVKWVLPDNLCLPAGYGIASATDVASPRTTLARMISYKSNR